MAASEYEDVGRATDKPKGFVKWQLIAYWTAILGLCSFIVGMLARHTSAINECNASKVIILEKSQERIDKIRVEYYQKLEDRTNRLEKVEERVEKALPNEKNIKQ